MDHSLAILLSIVQKRVQKKCYRLSAGNKDGAIEIVPAKEKKKGRHKFLGSRKYSDTVPNLRRSISAAIETFFYPVECAEGSR